MGRISVSSNGTSRHFQLTVWWKPGCAEVTSFTHLTSDPDGAIQTARQYAARADVARVELLYVTQLGNRRNPIVRKVKFS